jgi:hypothetical protein
MPAAVRRWPKGPMPAPLRPRILQVFLPHIFFVDLGANLEPAEDTVPAGKVPYRLDSSLQGGTPGVIMS